MRDLPAPEPQPGHVTIQVRAFGLNHAEMHMHKGEWDEWMPVTGIECVGIVSACPGAQFEVGSKVAAVMGGMGRSIPGSHTEYTRVPVTNVVQHFHSDTIRHSFTESVLLLSSQTSSHVGVSSAPTCVMRAMFLSPVVSSV